ncbi:hypothetical protein Tco_1476929 [Tanacetum coccineum]
MSSPDHPTANLEDAFSSNFPNYPPLISPDYVSTSPGKTYSSTSNSFGIVLLTSPNPFDISHDPYINLTKGLLLTNAKLSPSNPHPNLKLIEIVKLPEISLTNVRKSKYRMPPKRASTTEAPAMTQDAIRKLVADSVTSALEAQAATMASASNPNRNTGPTGTPSRKWKPTRVH